MASATTTFSAIQTFPRMLYSRHTVDKERGPVKLSDDKFGELACHEFTRGSLRLAYSPESQRGYFSMSDSSGSLSDSSGSFSSKVDFQAKLDSVFDLILSKSHASDSPPIFITQTYSSGNIDIQAFNRQPNLKALAQKVDTFLVEGQWLTAKIASTELEPIMPNAVFKEFCTMTVPARMFSNITTIQCTIGEQTRSFCRRTDKLDAPFDPGIFKMRYDQAFEIRAKGNNWTVTPLEAQEASARLNKHYASQTCTPTLVTRRFPKTLARRKFERARVVTGENIWLEFPWNKAVRRSLTHLATSSSSSCSPAGGSPRSGTISVMPRAAKFTRGFSPGDNCEIAATKAGNSSEVQPAAAQSQSAERPKTNWADLFEGFNFLLAPDEPPKADKKVDSKGDLSPTPRKRLMSYEDFADYACDDDSDDSDEDTWIESKKTKPEVNDLPPLDMKDKPHNGAVAPHLPQAASQPTSENNLKSGNQSQEDSKTSTRAATSEQAYRWSSRPRGRYHGPPMRKKIPVSLEKQKAEEE